MQASPKVLCIGFDAADCSYIETHARDLPNFASFLKGGALHRLQVEPLSGAVWATFLTGTTPDQHGFFHHMQWDPSTLRVRRTHPDWIGPVQPFWRDLAGNGLKVSAFDVPFSFRGDTHGALEVANWGSHDLVEPIWCSDRATWDRINRVAKHHPMRFEVPVRKSLRKLAPMLDQILFGTDQKTDIALDLMAQDAWDLCLVVYGETHRGGHIFWPDPAPDAVVPADALARIYKAADDGLGRLLAAVDDTTHVVIFALHGMGHNQSQSHLSRPMLDAALGIGAEPEKPGFGLVRALRGAVPHSIQHRIAEQVPMAVRDFVLARELVGGLDWRTTKAFSLQGDVSGYWRLNVAGREAQGIVTDPDALRAAIAKAFDGYQAPDGQPLVQCVHFPSAEGQGDRSALLPDILVEWTDDLVQQTSATHPVTGTITGQPDTGRTGNHRFQGFIAHRGPDGFAPPDHIKGIGAALAHLLGAAGQ